MSIDLVLAGLQGVRRTAPRKWQALCPAHEDGVPSLSIGEGNDGCVLLYCFAGCDTESVIRALGLRWEDLMEPLPPGAHSRPRARRLWSVRDALALIEQEATMLAIIVADLDKRGVLPPGVKERALKATSRLSGVADALR
jgi:hypothetical protein